MIHGVGVDLVHLDRFRRFLDDHSARVDEMFTPAELAARPRLTSLAAAFAIKEAALKAIGGLTGWELDWREIGSGGTAVALAGSVSKHARALGVGALHATLSRSGQRVIATVIAERRAR